LKAIYAGEAHAGAAIRKRGKGYLVFPHKMPVGQRWRRVEHLQQRMGESAGKRNVTILHSFPSESKHKHFPVQSLRYVVRLNQVFLDLGPGMPENLPCPAYQPYLNG
jgi:hypothetical protein